MACNDDDSIIGVLPKLHELAISEGGDANMPDDKSESTFVCIGGGVSAKVQE